MYYSQSIWLWMWVWVNRWANIKKGKVFKAFNFTSPLGLRFFHKSHWSNDKCCDDAHTEGEREKWHTFAHTPKSIERNTSSWMSNYIAITFLSKCKCAHIPWVCLCVWLTGRIGESLTGYGLMIRWGIQMEFMCEIFFKLKWTWVSGIG